MSNAAARADISSTRRHPICSSVADGISRSSSRIRGRQKFISCFSTLTAITGLQVAPTEPSSTACDNSSIDAESFQRQVGVVCVILCKGLLQDAGMLVVAITTPISAHGCVRRQLLVQDVLDHDS